jgi:transcriptional regulator with XRE-family HTH domain
MSREQLAKAAGMKVGGIRDLEQGLHVPSWKTVLALCGALGVSCETFTQPPAERPPPTPRRPRKAEAPEGSADQPATPRRPRGRPRKADG